MQFSGGAVSATPIFFSGEPYTFVYELLDGNWRKVPRDSLLYRLLGGFATECDGLEDLPSAHIFGNANRLAPGLRGKGRDRLRGQASSVAAWRVFESRRHLDGVEELIPLRLWKTEHQPSQRRQKSPFVARL
jgi:hypothetical protein